MAGSLTDVVAVDFRDRSAIVRDTTTPANNFVGAPDALLTWSSSDGGRSTMQYAGARGVHLATTDQMSILTSAMPFSATAGLMYIEAEVDRVVSSSSGLVALSDGTTSNRIYLFIDTADDVTGAIVRAGATQAFSVLTESGAAGIRRKAAITWEANNVKVGYNGNTATTDVSALIPTVSRFDFGKTSGAAGATTLSGYIQKFLYRPIRVADADLLALTS